jgi:hypothetical protein
MQSVPPDRDLLSLVPPGSYYLFFTFLVGESSDNEISKIDGFVSNKVNLVIQSSK